jgi:pyruvate dehydrogenase E2 component (dihydrolipoamide acetyltransferase)
MDEVKLPRLGQGMESGTIVRWLKSKGDHVQKGEPLFEVDTEKATQEVEAETSGVLLEISVESGEVPVGALVALIGEPGESPASKVDEEVAEPAEAEEKAAAPAAAPAPARVEENSFRTVINGVRGASSGSSSPGRAKASPLARRMARERGIDLGTLTGTGPDGRIVAEDVERGQPDAPPPPPAREEAAASVEEVVAAPAEAAPVETAPVKEAPPVEAAPPAEAAPPVVEAPVEAVAPVATPPAVEAPAPVSATAAAPSEAGEVESIPLTRTRKTIARRLTEAWTVPVFQLTVSVEMTHANELIARSRELNPDVRVTVTDLIAKVCARALMRHPDVNVQFTEEAILQLPSAHIGLAVAAPKGLVVPVVRSVERLSLVEVAKRRDELVARAKEGALERSDLDGGTFTISNLGMFGIEHFTAVLNPPQAAILAVGATADRPVAQDGQVVVRPMMTVTLTVDHRAVDGAPAADFLRTVKTFLEDPALAL